jgi:hypothetical protein
VNLSEGCTGSSKNPTARWSKRKVRRLLPSGIATSAEYHASSYRA